MNQEMIDYIRQRAAQRGMDPDVVMKVVRGEGGLNNPFQHGLGPAPHSQDPALGKLENSYGPLQLYISGNGAGMGDRALAAGIDPRTDWKGGFDFGLNEAAKTGWGQWYGAKKAGVTGFQGINRDAPPLAYNTPVPGTSLASNPMQSTAGPQSAADSNGGAGYVAPLPPAQQIAGGPPVGNMNLDGNGGNAPTQPAPVAPAPANNAPAPPAVPLGTTVMDNLKAGNYGQALGALGSSQGFMDAAGGLAKTMTGGQSGNAQQAQKGAAPPPPNLDTNSAAIAQAAPQLMANLMARRRIPGMSIGGMA